MAIAGVLAIGALGLRAAFLGTVRANDLGAAASAQQLKAIDVPGPRGAIRSRDGRILARDQLAVDISATPYLLDDPPAAARRLAAILAIDEDELTGRLSAGGGYAVVARGVDPELGERVKELELAGVDVRDTFVRQLPRGKAAAQLLGLTDQDGKGISGLEQQFDDDLTGSPGRRVEVQDAFGAVLRVPENRDPQPGKSLRLTLDARIQDRAEQVAIAARRDYGAKGVTALVMRPRDGAILAMVSVPRFDPANRRRINLEAQKIKPVTDTFEPGSTFKVVTVAGALQRNVVRPTTRFTIPRSYRLYDRTLRDSHDRGADVTRTVSQIIEESSNIGTVRIAEKLGPERVQAWIERFGFGRQTGVDIPGETQGLVLPIEEWSGVSILNLPIGQGVGVTLTQLARAYAAIANGGYLVTPHVVNRVGGGPPAARPRTRILNRRTATQLNQMLKRVVSPAGTGQAADVPGFEVAGKTGTANKFDPDSGEYSRTRFTASFVGYLPADRPELLIAVAIDEPQGLYYGGEVAAPAFEEIAQFSLQQLKITP